jgi:MerR family transcriptional regulator/heat shock protein HspR
VSTQRRRMTTITASVDRERGVFMISVAAELAEMHPQTLRMYEQRGLITPKRSPKGTRLYSQSDVDRLRRIQQMTAELGMNLAGVERVLEMEQQLERMSRRVEQLERRAERLQRAPSGPSSCATRRPASPSCRCDAARGRSADAGSRTKPSYPRSAALGCAKISVIPTKILRTAHAG